MEILTFTVDSALLRELGEKLVETVHLALVELVKNCYDADATEVQVTFERVKGKTLITVKDNGKGMSFEAVQTYWMRIATSNKTATKTSTVFGRPLTGAKGIGRFSCRRLGGHLKLITRGTAKGDIVGKADRVEETIVEFPWKKFEPGTDVTLIKCEGEKNALRNVSTGTTLIISDLAEEWTKGGFSWLKRQLAVLAANQGVRRRGYEEDLGFKVKLSTPDFKGGVSDLRDELMDAGWGTISARIENGKAICKLDALGLGKRTITSPPIFKNLKDVSILLAIMVDGKDQLRNKKVLSLGTMQKILDEWGGVQVRYKGFRVYPYGDDDWLDIDYDRGMRKANPKDDDLFAFAQSLKGVDPSRSLLNMLSMKSYVGNVEIGENAKGFEMKANREGFLASKELEEVRNFARYVIHWTTILRDFYIRQRSQEDSIIAKAEFEQITDEDIEPGKVINAAVNYLQREVTTLSRSLPPAQRRVVERSFQKATEAIIKQHEASQQELSHLRLIASTSTLLLIFSHEVRSLLGILEQSKNSLSIIAESLQPKVKKSIGEVSESFGDLKTRLEELLELTSLVGVDQRKAKPGQVALLDRILRVKKVFDLIIAKYDIEVDFSGVPKNVVIKKILESELYSILLNIISNSIKSVIAAGGNRKIQITAIREDGVNTITIRDTGIGLDPLRFEEVFTPFISDPDGKLYQNLEKRLNPEDNLIVGTGTGLGLGIVKEIILSHDGSIKFVKPKRGWDAELEIKMP